VTSSNRPYNEFLTGKFFTFIFAVLLYLMIYMYKRSYSRFCLKFCCRDSQHRSS